MDSILIILKKRARDLHRQASGGDVPALEKIALLPEMKSEPLGDLAETVRRKHCLAVVARDLGFPNWTSLTHFLSGAQRENFGTLLYPRGSYAFTNIWVADYGDAKEAQAREGGYLLAYKRHFFVAGTGFIRHLGFDPDAPDWRSTGFDWVRPDSLEARNRLFAQLVR